jgi:anaerobic C4-dicarboxylate transporter
MVILATILAQDTGSSTVPVQFVLAVLCVIVLSSVALGVCVGLARRMQQIAERTPRKNPPQPPPADTFNDDQAPN